MKKLILAAFLMGATLSLKAQYGTLNAILDRLEEKRGISQNLKDVAIDNKNFVYIQDFEDHTERNILSVKGNSATFIEMFDDKKTGETSSNVFSGDVVRTAHNMLSFRFDKLEGKKIALPITKTLLMKMQKKIIYLIDVNNKQRWIDEASVNKK